MTAEAKPVLSSKTKQLEEELKAAGLWQKDIPAWVQEYEPAGHVQNVNFAEWLQFVFIPNQLKKNRDISPTEKKLIVPQAMRYFGDDVKKGNLLQVLIEIDALL